MKNIQNYSASVKALDVFNDFIVSGTIEGELKVTNLDTTQYLHSNESIPITCVKMNEKYLIVAYKNLIHVITVADWLKKFVFFGVTSPMNAMDISENVLVAGFEDSLLKV